MQVKSTNQSPWLLVLWDSPWSPAAKLCVLHLISVSADKECFTTSRLMMVVIGSSLLTNGPQWTSIGLSDRLWRRHRSREQLRKLR